MIDRKNVQVICDFQVNIPTEHKILNLSQLLPNYEIEGCLKINLDYTVNVYKINYVVFNCLKFNIQ